MTKSVLGIIGGSGIYDLPGLVNVREERIKSPWGEPSAPLRIGDIAGLPVVFLSRHGKGHRLSPTDINYRANIDALKRAGVTDLISLSACGSFKEELAPGTFVLVDQFVDRTYARNKFVLRHRLGRACLDGASGLAAASHPRWPRPPKPKASTPRAAAPTCASKARNSPRSPKASPTSSSAIAVIGMTNMPEAKLAREAEICLRHRRHGHRLRLLAPRPRRGHRAGGDQGAGRQRREGQATW